MDINKSKPSQGLHASQPVSTGAKGPTLKGFFKGKDLMAWPMGPRLTKTSRHRDLSAIAEEAKKLPSTLSTPKREVEDDGVDDVPDLVEIKPDNTKKKASSQEQKVVEAFLAEASQKNDQMRAKVERARHQLNEIRDMDPRFYNELMKNFQLKYAQYLSDIENQPGSLNETKNPLEFFLKVVESLHEKLEFIESHRVDAQNKLEELDMYFAQSGHRPYQNRYEAWQAKIQARKGEYKKMAPDLRVNFMMDFIKGANWFYDNVVADVEQQQAQERSPDALDPEGTRGTT